jgi:hypothetical protein
LGYRSARKKEKRKKILRSSSILATFPTYCLRMAISELKKEKQKNPQNLVTLAKNLIILSQKSFV